MPTSSQFAHCRGASQEHKNSGGEGREKIIINREEKIQLNSKKEKRKKKLREEELNISRNNSKL